MGEVYEAEDLELRERVALKTIRAAVAEDERANERFRREIQLARKVTHPNVCRVFDVFRHRTESSVVTLVSMELLPGETLADRLFRAGRMTQDQALPLVVQMAAALAAAHKVNVIHRDFKTSNVILVPADGNETRAVVTDFGLARGAVYEEDVHASLTETGIILGTPAYMAPEQVEGGKVTTATDIYALGIVLYEMVTGERPFSGETPFAIAVKRLREAPVPPRRYVSDLDSKWEKTILRCLARDPADRYASAADVAGSLRGEDVPRGSRDWQRRRRRIGAAIGVAALIAAVGFLLLRHASQAPADLPRPAAHPAIPVKPRRSVAVLGFKNLSGRSDAAWISTALSEMLTTELAAGEKLRTIPGENVARMKVEMSLADSESFGKETLQQIRKNLGTDLLVLGSYFSSGEQRQGTIRVDLRLQDTVAGETLVMMPETGTEADLSDLVSRAGARLREKLGVVALSTAESEAVRSSFPSNTEAARLYAEGVARLRLFDAPAARNLLEKAVAAEPNYPLAHAALSDAWSGLGYDSKAEEESKKAFEMSAKLSREDRLWIEGRHRERTRELDKAEEIYRALFKFFPDNIEYGLRLADRQKPKEALLTLATLRKLPPPISDDPRIGITEAREYMRLFDNAKALASIEAAIAKGQAQGSRRLVAEAIGFKGAILEQAGEGNKAFSAYEAKRDLCSSLGDQVCMAAALTNLAIMVDWQGNVAEALKMQQEALEKYGKLGNKYGVAAQQVNVGSTLRPLGRLSEAKRMFEQAFLGFRETGRKGGMATALENVADILVREGRIKEAKKKADEALVYRREQLAQRGLKNPMRLTLYCLVDVLIPQGELDEARKIAEGWLAEREDSYLSLRLAEILLEQGNPASAEAGARKAAAAFHKERRRDDEAEAYVLVARALQAQAKASESQEALQHALALSADSQNRFTDFIVSVAAARADAAAGAPEKALKNLHAKLAEARKHGFVDSQFQVILAVGEIELKSGRAAAGRARLGALEKEAREKGYGLIARKAAATLKAAASTAAWQPLGRALAA